MAFVLEGGRRSIVSPEERRKLEERSAPVFTILSKGDCFDPAYEFARTPYGKGGRVLSNDHRYGPFRAAAQAIFAPHFLCLIA